MIDFVTAAVAVGSGAVGVVGTVVGTALAHHWSSQDRAHDEERQDRLRLEDQRLRSAAKRRQQVEALLAVQVRLIALGITADDVAEVHTMHALLNVSIADDELHDRLDETAIIVNEAVQLRRQAWPHAYEEIEHTIAQHRLPKKLTLAHLAIAQRMDDLGWPVL